MFSVMVAASPLLKLTAILTGVGFLTTLGKDLHENDVFKKIGRLLKVNVKTIKSIPLENEHSTVLGLTRHGKTYAIIKSLDSLKEGVLFINVQRETVSSKFVRADGNNTPGQIFEQIQKGRKINYLPSDNLEQFSKEIGFLINKLYSYGDLNIRIVIDETHLLSQTKNKEGLNGCIRVATTGLRRGYKAVFITQRPAMLHNTLYSQSLNHVLFALGKVDESYLKEKGFPVAEIVEKTRNEKYHFALFDQKEVKGAFKIG